MRNSKGELCFYDVYNDEMVKMTPEETVMHAKLIALGIEDLADHWIKHRRECPICVKGSQ